MSQPYVGEIRMFGGNFPPVGWELCSGQLLPISEFDTLFNLIGTTFGGDGQSTFGLPDLQGRVPMHEGQGPGISQTYTLGEKAGTETVTLTTNQIPVHSHVPACSSLPGNSVSPQDKVWASAAVQLYSGQTPNTDLQTNLVGPSGGNQPHENMAPFLAVTFIIATFGVFPSPTSGAPGDTPFLAELKLLSFNFAPRSWASCNGQFLPINQNQALFSLLGTTYGGNGQTTFALPDLRGRVPVHRGSVLQGESAGGEFHTVTIGELPAHVHPVGCIAGQAGQAASTGNVWGTSGLSPYAGSVNSNMNPACITNVGGSQPHSNLQPYLTLHWVIALQGIFPSQS